MSDFDSVMRAQAEWEATPDHKRPRSSPIMKYTALQEIERLRQQHEASGFGWDILAAVRKCAAADIAMPDWLANAYCERYDRVLSARAGSWDDAFDRPYAKGKQIGRVRADREDRLRVYLAVREALLSEPRPAVDEQLFEGIGVQLGIGKTRANRLYYEAVKLFPEH